MQCPKCNVPLTQGRKGWFCEDCGLRISSASGDLPTTTGETPSLVSDATIQDDVTSLQSGRYSIIETLGKGGMGVVYRALDTRLKRNVAIKGMLPELLGSDRSEQRFIREAQAIASINQQNVIRVFDYFCEGGAYYIVMEYFQGLSLADYVSGLTNPDAHDFTPIFSQICDALEAVHSQGQVHRDLKPSNVLVSSKVEIKLIDFGLVKGGGLLVSVRGKYLGTPGYTAPEQEIDSMMADVRSDIYSMGGLIYFCTSGGKHPPRVVFPNQVPTEYRGLIIKCLQESQQDRFQSVRELRAVLGNSESGQTHESTSMIVNTSTQDSSSPTSSPSESMVSPIAEDVQIFDGIEFVYCPAGTFVMGKEGNDDFEQAYEVKISRGFWLGKFPVTQGQWNEIMGDWPGGEPDTGRGAFYPMYYVSWEDAQNFIAELNVRSGEEHYRFPTEAEWEYACRAGSTSAYCFGDSESKLKNYAWFGEDFKSGGTHPVGKRLSNAWGLHDMHGNVWEWCEDWYDENYYHHSPRVDPVNTSGGSIRVIRGGSWNNGARYCSSEYRSRRSPSSRGVSLGFRLLRTP